MLRIKGILFALTFAAFIGCGKAEDVNTATSPAAATIYGHTRIDSTKPLPGAMINIVDMNERLIVQPYSDENGDFTVFVDEGQYIIVPQPVFGAVNYIHPERDTIFIYAQHSLETTISYRQEGKQ